MSQYWIRLKSLVTQTTRQLKTNKRTKVQRNDYLWFLNFTNGTMELGKAIIGKNEVALNENIYHTYQEVKQCSEKYA